MADADQFKLVRQGVAIWNAWKETNLRIKPDLSRVHLRGADLNGADFNRTDLNGANLRGASLSSAKLSEANLSSADLSEAYLSGAYLGGANLVSANLNSANLSKANLSKANLCGATLIRANLCKANLYAANLSRAHLSKANLGEADLSKANLDGADLDQADLKGANLDCSKLSEANLYAAKLNGANLSSAKLRRANLVSANLNGANLSGAKLSGANLSWASLSETNFGGADLRGANLRKASLSEVDLSGADLRGTDLSGAYLLEANLSGADLSEANLSWAHLRGAKLSETDLSGAKLSGADLSNANLNNANLSAANLIQANLDYANITRTCLWEVQHSDWSIKGIICREAFWDREPKREAPSKYDEGEFERLFAEKPRIVLRYPGGMSSVDLFALPLIVKRLQVEHPGSVLYVRSVQNDTGGASVTITVENLADRSPAAFERELVSIQTKLECIIDERDRLQQRFDALVSEGISTIADLLALPRQEIHVHRPAGLTAIEGPTMSRDTYKVSGIAAVVGPGGHAHDNTLQQIQGSIDLPKLEEQLRRLREAMKKQATGTREQDKSIGAVADAEEAAVKGDGLAALRYLKGAGVWALGIAEQIGVAVATEALKKAMLM